jgi:hypothetical protein
VPPRDEIPDVVVDALEGLSSLAATGADGAETVIDATSLDTVAELLESPHVGQARDTSNLPDFGRARLRLEAHLEDEYLWPAGIPVTASSMPIFQLSADNRTATDAATTM